MSLHPDPIIIPYEEGGDLVHSAEHPFCGDMSCPCHADQTLIGELADRFEHGLLLPNEASDLYHGKGGRR